MASTRTTATCLKVGGPKAALDVLVIEHVDLNGDKLLQVAQHKGEYGELDAQRRGRVCWTCDAGGGEVVAAQAEHGRLQHIIAYHLDRAITLLYR